MSIYTGNESLSLVLVSSSLFHFPRTSAVAISRKEGLSIILLRQCPWQIHRPLAGAHRLKISILKDVCVLRRGSLQKLAIQEHRSRLAQAGKPVISA